MHKVDLVKQCDRIREEQSCSNHDIRLYKPGLVQQQLCTWVSFAPVDTEWSIGLLSALTAARVVVKRFHWLGPLVGVLERGRGSWHHTLLAEESLFSKNKIQKVSRMMLVTFFGNKVVKGLWKLIKSSERVFNLATLINCLNLF